MYKIVAIGAILALLQAVVLNSCYAQVAASRPSTPLPVRDTPFPDVPKDHWAYQAVEAVRKAGVIVGYPASVPTQPTRKPIAAKKRG